MHHYELTFATGSVSDELEDAIYEAFDALVSSHGTTTLLTLTAIGKDAESAARAAVLRLERLGVRMSRLVEDFVTRRDIAERANVTPQAVGLWIRGERHQHVYFPDAYTFAGGGLWWWGEVNDWLRSQHRAADEIGHPSTSDHVRISAWMESRRAQAPKELSSSTR